MYKEPIEHQIDGTRKKKKILSPHNNQNIKCTEQRKNIKTCKRKRPSTIQRQIYQNYTRLLNRDPKSQKSLDRYHPVPLRTQIPAQNTIPSKTLINIDGKQRYFITKPNLNNIFLLIQPYRGFNKESKGQKIQDRC